MRYTMLKPCPECKNSVSDTAETCPHCGYRLLGRENLVYCPRCRVEVLPEIVPHDTISRYCPLCKLPMTNLLGRKFFFALFGLFVVVAISLIIFMFKMFQGFHML
jgi:hypothetical protein